MRAIIAQNLRGYIGLKDNLPFYSPDDMRHFKKLTSEGSGAVIVGFNTSETLPPLKGRIIHVINTRDGNWYEELQEFIKQYPDAWVIGGRKTYQKLLHLIDEVHISLIKDNSVGDTFSLDFNQHPHHHVKVYRYHFDGVSNFNYINEFMLIANKKKISFTFSCNVKEDKSYLLIGLKADKFEFNPYKPLNSQNKAFREFMYKFLTDPSFYNESAT